MGAVEAVSLSILVGSSVDYCIHLIEGYLVAGDDIPKAETKVCFDCESYIVHDGNKARLLLQGM